MALEMNLRFGDVLRDHTLKNTYINANKNGYQFEVRLGYYRGHYLSTIENFALTVNGDVVDNDQITFNLNGKSFHPDELKYQVSEFWQIIEPAIIKVHLPGGLAVGTHQVGLTLKLRSPYMPLPGADGRAYVIINSDDSKEMTLIGEGEV